MVYVHRKRRSTTFTCCFTSFRYTVCHVIRPPKCLLPTSLDASQDCLNYAGWRKSYNSTMEDGGVDTTVIDSRQHKIGQMADFPTLLASSVSDL